MDFITFIAGVAAITAAFYSYKTYRLQSEGFALEKQDRLVTSNPVFHIFGSIDKFEGSIIYFKCRIKNISEYQANIKRLSFLFHFDNPKNKLAYCTIPYDPDVSNITIDRANEGYEILLPIDLKYIITPSQVNLILCANYIDKYAEEKNIQQKFEAFDIKKYLAKIES